MAEPTQYAFELQETAIALVKQQNITDGLWMIAFEFGLATGIFGATNSDAKPGSMIQINKVLLVRVPEGQEHPSFVVDAAAVNPKKANTK